MLRRIHGPIAFALLAAGGLFAQDGPVLVGQQQLENRRGATSDGFVLPPAPDEPDAGPPVARDDANRPRAGAARDVLPPAPGELDGPADREASAAPPAEAPAERAQPAFDPNRQNYLGVITDRLPDSLAAQFSDMLGDSASLLVRSVRPGSAAEQAGLRPNDILVAYNGEALAAPEDLKRLVVTDEPGATVELSIIRAAQPETLTLELGQRIIAAPAAREPRRIVAAPPDLGPPRMDIRLPGRRSIIVDRHGLVTPWIAVEWGSPLAGRRFQALTPDGRQFDIEVRVHPEAWSPRPR